MSIPYIHRCDTTDAILQIIEPPLPAAMVYAFSSDTRFAITEPVIGMCNFIRAIGWPWYNILWLDTSMRRQLGAIPSIS